MNERGPRQHACLREIRASSRGAVAACQGDDPRGRAGADVDSLTYGGGSFGRMLLTPGAL